MEQHEASVKEAVLCIMDKQPFNKRATRQLAGKPSCMRASLSSFVPPNLLLTFQRPALPPCLPASLAPRLSVHLSRVRRSMYAHLKWACQGSVHSRKLARTLLPAADHPDSRPRSDSWECNPIRDTDMTKTHRSVHAFVFGHIWPIRCPTPKTWLQRWPRQPRTRKYP